MPEPKTPRGPLLFVALPAVRPRRASVPWPRLLVEAALAAEQAGIDALVVESGAGLPEPALDPVVVLAGLAPRTYRLGLVAELPVTSPEPARTAWELASLDAMSGGRAGCLLPEGAAGPPWHGRSPVVLTSSATGHTVTGPRLALDVLTMVPGETAADRLAVALTRTRTDGLLIRCLAGPGALARFAVESVPLLRERGLLPVAQLSPRGLRERLPAAA
ncbi:LLM class flavin-dependent oxidoreductase [Streptomyces sp. ITFR-6]|uniref:LLM class flavin-dependent oxidoreductase n=1 Tax=Streptomyces sp. ITFR-6 TaxID=3075197 RepID=UPI00288AB0C3|nr:LLM class flavin-dependent oxidoreductase [Streptomyces sp. ITFR-6]WNI30990.1 LLM class flavin-dependent oxidoreductase [Streptomyces sp. ITFR-6]